MLNVCFSINIPEQYLAFIESNKLQKKPIIFQLQLAWLNQTAFQFSNKQTNKHGEPLLEGEEVEVVEVPGFLVINKGLVS